MRGPPFGGDPPNDNLVTTDADMAMTIGDDDWR
jgi:hypothetical protein